MEKATRPRWTEEEFLLTGLQHLESQFEDVPPKIQRGRGRMSRIAMWLAFLTIVSMFWVGVTAWSPVIVLQECISFGTLMPIRRVLLANWIDGLQFSLGLMAILVAHELGHYFTAIYYRVESTPPLFIPFPFSPIGTFGAVIAMHSGQADRRQIFDIGLAGPLTGLVVAIPILAFGIFHPDHVAYAPDAALRIGQPLLVQWLGEWLAPDRAEQFISMTNAEANPFLMAGWVGLLVTGLNMMPLGQLDGGHVTFGLFGQRVSLWVAIGTVAAAIGYMIYMQIIIFGLMLFLVLLIGLKHPPSSDDSRTLGVTRRIIGWLSLSLPLLCIPGNPLQAF